MAEKKQQPTEEHVLDLTRLSMVEECQHKKRGALTLMWKLRRRKAASASGLHKKVLLVEIAAIEEYRQHTKPNEPVRKPRPAQPPTPSTSPAPWFGGYDDWREQD